MKDYSKLSLYIVMCIAMDAKCSLAPKTTLCRQAKVSYWEKNKKKVRQ